MTRPPAEITEALPPAFRSIVKALTYPCSEPIHQEAAKALEALAAAPAPASPQKWLLHNHISYPIPDAPAPASPDEPSTAAAAELKYYLHGALIGYPDDATDRILAGALEYVVAIEREARETAPNWPDQQEADAYRRGYEARAASASVPPLDLLRRLVAVVDAASMTWTDPVPADSINAIHDAKEYLAAAEIPEQDRP